MSEQNGGKVLNPATNRWLKPNAARAKQVLKQQYRDKHGLPPLKKKASAQKKQKKGPPKSAKPRKKQKGK